MPQADRIIILRTSGDGFNRRPYVIRLLAEEWRERGIAVEVADQLSEPTGPDTLVFPHLDLTVIPPALGQALARCARVINRSVPDISKRVISRNLITSADQHDGPVIVKTNLNFGGLPEVRALERRGGPQARMLNRLLQQPWPISGVMRTEDYRIYDYPELVPQPVWSNPRLVVERFLPEREGELYCIRQYVFLGPCEINTRSVSPDPLVKASNVIRREVLDKAPAPVCEFRAQLGFDYGKFDYVLHGDEAIVFDVNRTPAYNPNSKAGSAREAILKLAPGIDAFLGRT